MNHDLQIISHGSRFMYHDLQAMGHDSGSIHIFSKKELYGTQNMTHFDGSFLRLFVIEACVRLDSTHRADGSFNVMHAAAPIFLAGLIAEDSVQPL